MRHKQTLKGNIAMIAVLAAIGLGCTTVPAMAASETAGREDQAAWSSSGQVSGEAPTLTNATKPESAGHSQPLLGFGLVALSLIVLVCGLSAQGRKRRMARARRGAYSTQTT